MIMEIIKQIMEKHKGYKNAIKRDVLHGLIIAEGIKIKDSDMRRIIKEMVDEGFLLGSHNAYGYFIIETQDDLNIALSELESKARSLFVRASRIKNSFSQKINPNGELPLNWNFNEKETANG